MTQPILNEGGIWLGTFSYSGDVGTAPGRAVSHTCDANCVVTPQGNEDRNLAHRLGFTLTVLRSKSGGETELFGDTLKVVLDVRRALRLEEVSLPMAVQATVDAIRENAARGLLRWPDMRFVSICISDSLVYRNRVAVYLISPHPHPRRKYD